MCGLLACFDFTIQAQEETGTIGKKKKQERKKERKKERERESVSAENSVHALRALQSKRKTCVDSFMAKPVRKQRSE